jgi:hypothetical protein
LFYFCRVIRSLTAVYLDHMAVPAALVGFTPTMSQVFKPVMKAISVQTEGPLHAPWALYKKDTAFALRISLSATGGTCRCAAAAARGKKKTRCISQPGVGGGGGEWGGGGYFRTGCISGVFFCVYFCACICHAVLSVIDAAGVQSPPVDCAPPPV